MGGDYREGKRNWQGAINFALLFCQVLDFALLLTAALPITHLIPWS